LNLRERLRLATLLGSARYSFIRGDADRTLRLLETAEKSASLSPAYQVFKATALTRTTRREEAASLLASVVDKSQISDDAETRYAVTYAQLLQALAAENFELAEVLFDRAKKMKVRPSIRRALPLLIKPSVEWFRSKPDATSRA